MLAHPDVAHRSPASLFEPVRCSRLGLRTELQLLCNFRPSASSQGEFANWLLVRNPLSSDC